jgi:Phage late-transcription coactivator
LLEKGNNLLQANLDILSTNDFPFQIEEIVKEKGVSYLDSIEIWCNQNGKDILAGAELVKKTPIIREKIKAEAEDLNLLPKTSRLKI